MVQQHSSDTTGIGLGGVIIVVMVSSMYSTLLMIRVLTAIVETGQQQQIDTEL